MAFNIKDKFGKKIEKFLPNKIEQPGLWITDLVSRANSKNWVTEDITDFLKQGWELCGVSGLLKKSTKNRRIYLWVNSRNAYIFNIYIAHAWLSHLYKDAILSMQGDN